MYAEVFDIIWSRAQNRQFTWSWTKLAWVQNVVTFSDIIGRLSAQDILSRKRKSIEAAARGFWQIIKQKRKSRSSSWSPVNRFISQNCFGRRKDKKNCARGDYLDCIYCVNMHTRWVTAGCKLATFILKSVLSQNRKISSASFIHARLFLRGSCRLLEWMIVTVKSIQLEFEIKWRIILRIILLCWCSTWNCDA